MVVVEMCEHLVISTTLFGIAAQASMVHDCYQHRCHVMLLTYVHYLL